MPSFSLVHWLVVLVIEAVWIIPLYKILGRVGWSRGWVLVALIPPLVLVMFWAIAFGRWKSMDVDTNRDGIRN